MKIVGGFNIVWGSEVEKEEEKKDEEKREEGRIRKS